MTCESFLPFCPSPPRLLDLVRTFLDGSYYLLDRTFLDVAPSASWFMATQQSRLKSIFSTWSSFLPTCCSLSRANLVDCCIDYCNLVVPHSSKLTRSTAAAVKTHVHTGTMLPTTSDLLIWMVWLCWTVLFLTDPALKNGKYAVFFPTPRRLARLMLSSGLCFAPGLLDVLRSTTPPTIAYFKTLQEPLPGVWAVYMLVLEKPG